MIVQDKDNNAIEIQVYGQHSDDIQIDYAEYLDLDKEVSENTIEYIYKNYSDELYEEWFNGMVSKCEYYEYDMER